MNEALTAKDIKEAFNGKINIYTYDELRKFKNIDDVLKPYGRAIILYFWDTEPHQGHWVGIFKTPRNSIEVFDSFGQVDRPLYDIPKKFKIENNENYAYLSKLLYDSPYETEYNEKSLQNKMSSVCGRYCIARLALSDIPIEIFQKLFTNDTKKNDEIILELTQ